MSERYIRIIDNGDGLGVETSEGLTETDAIALLRSVLIVTEARFVQRMTGIRLTEETET